MVGKLNFMSIIGGVPFKKQFLKHWRTGDKADAAKTNVLLLLVPGMAQAPETVDHTFITMQLQGLFFIRHPLLAGSLKLHVTRL